MNYILVVHVAVASDGNECQFPVAIFTDPSEAGRAAQKANMVGSGRDSDGVRHRYIVMAVPVNPSTLEVYAPPVAEWARKTINLLQEEEK